MPERADNSPRWILRRTAKAVVAGALCAAGARRVVNLVRRREAGGVRVLILAYHRPALDVAGESRESLPSLLVSAATLKRQLEQVARERDVVPLADAVRLLAEPAPRRGPSRDVAVVTFDDGYVSVHDVALPLLASLRMPASVFVPTGYVGTARRLLHDRLHGALSELWRLRRPPSEAGLPAREQAVLDGCAAEGPAATLDLLIARRSHDELSALAAALERRVGLSERDLPHGTRLLSWEEARACDAGGIEVGGHTVEHVALANVPLSRVQAEVHGCAGELERRLGRRPRHFAYPNGLHTPSVRRTVAEAGFEAAVTTEDVENRRGGDPLALKRKTLWEYSSLGLAGYSEALAACNLDGVFGALGLSRAVAGERPDLAPEPERVAG
jgi:peptidoglycan/xylan/chitin deacetylase (PgdA/CDA1 family)